MSEHGVLAEATGLGEITVSIASALHGHSIGRHLDLHEARELHEQLAAAIDAATPSPAPGPSWTRDDDDPAVKLAAARVLRPERECACEPASYPNGPRLRLVPTDHLPDCPRRQGGAAA